MQKWHFIYTDPNLNSRGVLRATLITLCFVLADDLHIIYVQFVHRHALSPVHFLHHVLRSFIFCFCFSFHYAYLISNCCFLNTCQNVINGVGWPDDRHGFCQSCMTQRPSLFTLISYYAIVFSFALMFANMVGLLHAMALMVLLLVGWVIWNNKPLPLLI